METELSGRGSCCWPCPWGNSLCYSYWQPADPNPGHHAQGGKNMTVTCQAGGGENMVWWTLDPVQHHREAVKFLMPATGCRGLNRITGGQKCVIDGEALSTSRNLFSVEPPQQVVVFKTSSTFMPLHEVLGELGGFPPPRSAFHEGVSHAGGTAQQT